MAHSLDNILRIFSNVVYREVISRCGHRGFGLRS